MFKGLVLALGLLVAGGNVADAATPSDQSQPPSPEVAELLRKLDVLLRDEGIPGAGIALIRNHRLEWVGGIGDADRARQQKVTADTPFAVGSVSKSFVALAVMQLVEAGKVDLEAPIARYLPDAPVVNRWEQEHPVTVAQVLEHTAGFDDLHFRSYATDIPNLPVSAGVRDAAVSYVVRWPPGERHSYSNPGYLLLGQLVERASGMSFDDYMEQFVFRQIGMARASFRYMDGMAMAQGYADDGRPEPYPHMPDRPSGGAHASARELAQFTLAMMRRKVPQLSRDSLLRIETPTTSAAARAGLRSGYALANETRQTHGFSLRRHTGGVPGFSAYYAYEPDYGFGFVVLLNRMAAPKAVTAAILDHLVKDLAPPAPHAHALKPAELERYTGYYRTQNPRISLFRFADALLGVARVTREGDALRISELIGESAALNPTGPNLFRADKQLSATVAFVREGDGTTTMVRDGDYMRPTNALSAWLPLVLTLVALLGYLICLIALLIRVMLRLRNRRPVEHWMLRTLPVCAVLCLGMHVVLFVTLSIDQIGHFGMGSLFLYATQLGFVACVLGSAWLLWRRWHQPMHRFVRVTSVVSSAGGLWLVGWLAGWGYLGIPSWIW